MYCQQCNTQVPEEAVVCQACGAKLVRQSVNDPLIGRTFLNQYIIRKKLGQGGYGSVYEADQPSISRKAAVKILHPHLASQPEIAIRFRREGLAASRLQHSSIVDIYNFGETDDGIIWIAMEHLDGETLSARLRRKGKLSSRELIEVLGPICEALQEAHQKGIIHRDLKPDNIILTRGPNGEMIPKLLDFGVAGLVDDIQVTSTGMMSGSPPYMPPEQWKGLKHTDARSDVYALGVTAYQCLTNRLPFEADTAPAWMQKHCAEQPEDLARFVNADISKATQTVILKSLLKDPSQRFQTPIEFKKALEDAERGIIPFVPASLAPTLPPSPTLQPTPTATASSNKTWMIAALSAVAAVSFVFVAQYLFQKPTEKIVVVNPSTQSATKIAIAQPPATQTSPGEVISNIPTSAMTRPAASQPTPEIKIKPKIKPPKVPEAPETPKMTVAQAKKGITDALRASKFTHCKQPTGNNAASVLLVIGVSGQILSVMEGSQTPQSICLANSLRGMTFPQFAAGESFGISLQMLLY
jgi:serine/threonine protein kinase